MACKYDFNKCLLGFLVVVTALCSKSQATYIPTNIDDKRHGIILFDFNSGDESDDCKDTSIFCGLQMKLCASDENIKQHCKFSCGLCVKTVTQVTAVQSVCKDDIALCSLVAHYCATDVKISNSCEKTCGTCVSITAATAPPGATGTKPTSAKGVTFDVTAKALTTTAPTTLKPATASTTKASIAKTIATKPNTVVPTISQPITTVMLTTAFTVDTTTTPKIVVPTTFQPTTALSLTTTKPQTTVPTKASTTYSTIKLTTNTQNYCIETNPSCFALREWCFLRNSFTNACPVTCGVCKPDKNFTQKTLKPCNKKKC